MDQTQRIDPNKTMLGGAPGANVTQMMGANDLGRTTAMAPQKGLVATLTASREATMANGPAREQYLLELSSPSDAPAGAGFQVQGTRMPLNLCLVIDRSGSMEGAPLEYVKQACHYVVDMLSANDVLSIVTFEETVEVLMAPQRVTSKQPIKDGISRLVPGNTTNLYDGMALAAAQLDMGHESGRVTRMILLTDGDPTSGIKDFHTLVQHAGEIKGKGTTVTFLGFGPDYNEELIASMAKKAGGNYYFIPRPELIPEIFRTELDKAFSVTARNITLDLKLARWVNLRAATGHTVPPGDREFSLTLADLEQGASIQQVFDFEFQNHPLGWYRVASGRLNYEDLITGKAENVDVDFVIEFTAEESRYSVPPNSKVSQAAQVAAMSRTVERTIMGLKTQQITTAAAVAELQKTQMFLLKDGRTVEAQEVTLALRALQSGDTSGAEKTLMGTVHTLDQGKKQN